MISVAQILKDNSSIAIPQFSVNKQIQISFVIGEEIWYNKENAMRLILLNRVCPEAHEIKV